MITTLTKYFKTPTLKEISPEINKVIKPNLEKFTTHLEGPRWNNDDYNHVVKNFQGDGNQCIVTLTSKFFKGKGFNSALLTSRNLNNFDKNQFVNVTSIENDLLIKSSPLSDLKIEKLYLSDSFDTFLFFNNLSLTHQNYREYLLLENNETIEPLILFLKQNNIKNMSNLEDFLLSNNTDTVLYNKIVIFGESLRRFTLLFHTKNLPIIGPQKPLDDSSILYSEKYLNESIEILWFLNSCL